MSIQVKKLQVTRAQTHLPNGTTIFFGPSWVVWGGYVGLERLDGVKEVIAEFYDALDVKPGDIAEGTVCHDGASCKTLEGPFDWKLGHIYRYRIEKSPRTAPDKEGVWWQITLADLTTETELFLGEIKTKDWGGLN